MTTKPPDEEGFGTDSPTLVRMVSGPGRLLGTILGNQYKIVEAIGEGGIGVVYRARQLTVDRDVAVKVLKKQWANDELAVRRFENEAQAIGRLRHPNTLRLYDCQRTPDGELYIVTELLSGIPLADLLRTQGRLPIERAVRTFDEICRSLAEAHAAGLVHRDLKPANVFLDRIGNEDVVKVLDFGIAKILQSSGITRAGPVPGTPQYMSPEQAAAGKIDHRADIYSLGVMLYEMIAGKAPFDGGSVMEILTKHITEKPPKFSESAPGVEVTPELERLVWWTLEKAPEDRPRSIDELRRYLPSILAQVTVVTPLLVPRQDTIAPVAPNAAIAPLAQRSDTIRLGTPSSVAAFDGGVRGDISSPPGAFGGASWTDVAAHRASRKWRWFSVLTGSLGVIFGVVIGYASIPTSALLPSHRPTSETELARGKIAADEDAPKAPGERPKTVTIATDPPGARVIAPDGSNVGVTPVEVGLSGTSTYLVVRDDGSNGTVTLSDDKDGGRTVLVALSGATLERRDAISSTPKPHTKRVEKKKKR